MSETIELLSCPFCGSTDIELDDTTSVAYVLCCDCGVTINGDSVTNAEMARRWNRRAAAPGEAEGDFPIRAAVFLADKRNVTYWATAYVEGCMCCGATRDDVSGETWHHAPGCLHLRARALRDSDES